MIDGAGGTNTLDYNTRTAQVDITLTGTGQHDRFCWHGQRHQL